MGELVRAIARSIPAVPPGDDGFFTQLQDPASAIRDRIAAYLDAALFESVIAAEVRALSTCGAFDRLFDLLTQFVSQVMGYRWLALRVKRPSHLGLHAHPSVRGACEAEARQTLSVADATVTLSVEDEDASPGAPTTQALVRPVTFGDEAIAKLPCTKPSRPDEIGWSWLSRFSDGPERSG